MDRSFCVLQSWGHRVETIKGRLRWQEASAGNSTSDQGDLDEEIVQEQSEDSVAAKQKSPRANRK